MARSYNQFNGMGNLAGDPEVRDLGNNGRQVCKLRVMFNDSYKDRDGNTVEKSFGIDVNVFGDQQIKYLEQYAQKGDRVLIADGTLDIRKYRNKDDQDAWATEIVVGPFKGNVSIQTTRKERDERGGGGRDDRDSRDDRGGSRGRDDDRGSSRGGRGDDRGGRDSRDDRGGSRGRDDDRGSSRGGNGGGRSGGFDSDMDDDVPF